MPRIAFLGTPATAVPVLRTLAEARCIHAVFCNSDKPAGRGRKLEAPPVKLAALERGLDLCQPESWKLPETRAHWESLGIELAIVVAYGHILPRWMLDSLPLGAWNLHYSLLPRWRGAAPVNHAILAGDAETGVSLMRLAPGMDAGPVLAQTRRSIALADTAENLLAALAEDAPRLLLDHLSAIEASLAHPVAQDPSRVTLAPKLTRDMALLDCDQPATTLHRQVRALQLWPGTECLLEDTVIKVCGVGTLRATSEAPWTLRWDRGGAWLSAGDGHALELTLLQRPGKPVQQALQALQPWGAQGTHEVRKRSHGFERDSA